MLILQLKQAETAMADGRLDEAFEIVRSEPLRRHRRGQKLIGRLARAYVARGQENLAAERIQPALLDCNKAEKLAGNTPGVARLRSDICAEMEQRRLRNQHRGFQVAQARRQIDDGWLSAGEKMLAEADDGQPNLVLEQAAMARLQIDEVVAKAEQALGRDDLCGALDVFMRAGVAGSQHEKITSLAARLRSLAADRIRDSFAAGRIDQAQSLWRSISPLANGNADMAELGLALSQSRLAAEHIAAGRPRLAVPLLRKVQVICPNAAWVRSATEQARQAAEVLEELAGSPLGLHDFQDEAGNACHEAPVEDTTSRDAARLKERPVNDQKVPAGKSGSSIPSKFVLEVDGVGSFLVVRDRRVSIGPVSSSAHPTVGLVADPKMPVATVERTDEDYFLRSAEPVQVNAAGTTEKLLVDGDRIALSPRCTMKFHTPNPASTTATLALSSARLGRSDIRRIILMDRDILIGPSVGSHIQAKTGGSGITLYVQGDKLVCAAEQTISVGGRPAGKRAALTMNEPVAIGPVSMVLTAVRD